MWNVPFEAPQNLSVLLALSRSACELMTESLTKTELLGLIDTQAVEALAFYELPPYSSLLILDALYARQCIGYFSKNASLDFGRDCEQVARETWLETEVSCRETNDRFRDLAGKANASNRTPTRVASILYAAQQKIAKVLGPTVPRIADLQLVFGPGATSCVQKKNACARTKLSARPSCSINVVPELQEFFTAWPQYLALHEEDDEMVWEADPGSDPELMLYTRMEYDVSRVTVEIADGRLGFVPKNAKTHRTVLVEPTINGVLQGGYGRYISQRLLRVGVDLSDQSPNQVAARIGSLTGDLATLDLSSASDLIATELVAHLLPIDWYMALYRCRTPVAVDGEDRIKLAKFSSMGNGFTFPLQSLIFWALVTAAQETFQDALKVRVYGDDIIAPVTSVPLILEVFQYCGFKINTLKSFWEGPFRESCGGDYYFGVNIRPLYIKEPLSYKILFILHNFYVRGSMDNLADGVLACIPEEVRLFGPDGFGDGHLLGDWQPLTHKRDAGWSGWLFDTYKEFGLKHKTLLPGDRILPAYSIYVSAPETWDAFTYDVLTGNLWSAGFIESSAPVPKGRGGLPHLSLPGVVGYKRVTLYTLTPR